MSPSVSLAQDVALNGLTAEYYEMDFNTKDLPCDTMEEVFQGQIPDYQTVEQSLSLSWKPKACRWTRLRGGVLKKLLVPLLRSYGFV